MSHTQHNPFSAGYLKDIADFRVSRHYETTTDRRTDGGGDLKFTPAASSVPGDEEPAVRGAQRSGRQRGNEVENVH